MRTPNLLVKFLLLSTLAWLAACHTQEPVQPSETLAEASDDTVTEHARKHADPTYVCPMHPQIVRNEPGNCPICGMDLVLQETEAPAEEESPESGPPIVTIRSETMQNLGVRTAHVERGPLQRHIETVGYVAYDEDRIAHVHPRASGWVEKLLIRATGEEVNRNEVLLRYYSPEVVTAQEEYLLALNGIKTSDTRGMDMVQGGRRRLRLLEVPESVIATIKKTEQVQETIPILSPAAGVVTELGVREGMFVKPEMELFAIADVSSVWVQVDVFAHQMNWVQVGNPATIRIAALPGEVWQGEVDYIYPELDPETRTLRVRLRFPNPDGKLKPNMFAEAEIHSQPKTNALNIPREALIISGDESRVVLALGQGRFQPKTVISGMRTDERIEILKGLQEGEEVVVSGQFLIDSESNLQASFQRMQAAPTEDAQHSTHAH
jgi:Cu(I)/Ag(I) efflux system membrane fusion protein